MLLRRIATAGALAASLIAGIACSPTAIAGSTAWSVAIGVPGFAISAGQPGYWGGSGAGYVGLSVGYGGYGYGGYGYGYRPAYRPHYRHYYPAPVPRVAAYPYPAPVAYVAPAPYPAVVAPVPYGVPVYAPRRVVVAPPVLRPPVVVPYGRY